MDIKKVEEAINNVSPSFCIAKWKQVTMHLQNGQTHSCHHPSTHTIPVEEIKINPSALHNTSYKKSLRKMMLEGQRPKECDYCWRVEDSGEGHYSDRIYKSSDSEWAYPYLNEIVSKPWDDDVDPSYVEVSFGNVCNFKCSYCNPHVSSQWMDEIERHGAYPTSDNYNDITWLDQVGLKPIPNNQHNPYVEAFWQWFPKSYKNLKYFRITGGEPLLNKNTFKVLDYIIDNPYPELDFSINTNLNPTDDIFNKFIEKMKIIINEKKIKRFTLFTSAEAHGNCAEYIRYGMNYDQWINNIYKVYKHIPSIQFVIMSTYNILSLTSYDKFLKDIFAIKQEYCTKDHLAMLLDIPYLRYPPHQSVFICEDEHLDFIKNHIKFMESNMGNSHRFFSESEVDKLRRIYSIVKNSDVDVNAKNENRKNFIRFVDEHDHRRNTNFLKTFPELKDTYEKWKTL